MLSNPSLDESCLADNNFMLAMKKMSSYISSNIHLLSIKGDTALFEPNIKELRNLEKIGRKPKDKQERDNLVMQMFNNIITKECQQRTVNKEHNTMKDFQHLEQKYR